jgi:hypothetical protein
MKCLKQPSLACLIGFSGFCESHKPPPSSDVRGILVPPHRDDQQNGQQSGYMLHHYCVDCRPGGCRGNIERVVARWGCPVASGEALVMIHRVMRSLLHRHTAMDNKMARDRAISIDVIVAQDHVMVH